MLSPGQCSAEREEHTVSQTKGHTLVETLVVLGIMMTILAMALPHYTKAIRSAKQVAGGEAKRQKNIAREATGGADAMAPAHMRQFARQVYRQTIDAGKFDLVITEVLFVCHTDDEFGAYYYTLIDPDEAIPIQMEAGRLAAQDPAGNTFLLQPVGNGITPGASQPGPLGWDFLSVDMGHMNSDSRHISVLHTNGQQEVIAYPGKFPATPAVAEFSQRFMEEVYPWLD
jgi:hypothetical protein